MNSRHRPRPVLAVAASSLVLVATMIAVGAAQQPQGRGQQGPPAPTGPMAPEKYKNIQVLTDVPADQLDVTMRYFVAATGISCSGCHVRDEATGELAYDKDPQRGGKVTAREMIKLVQTVNAGDFGAKISCGTCHAGHNSPPGLQAAQMMTAEQIAAFDAQQAAMAARQGGAGRGPAPGGAPGGQRGAPGAPGQGGPGGRGPQTPAPPVDDVINKYIEGLGGRAAIEKLQAVMMTGTLTNRAEKTMPFTIEEKGARYRETIESQPDASVRAFDGTMGWAASGSKSVTLDPFPMKQVARDNDLMLALTLKEKFPNLTAGRPSRLTLTPGATPIDVNSLNSGTPAADYTTETLYFDATSGLLLRKTVRTLTGLRGSMTEQWDYSDYRAVNGVKMPFEIKHTNWAVVDTFKIADIKANPSIADARFAKPKS